MAYETLRLEWDEALALITFNRPEKRNAISTRMIEEILGAPVVAAHSQPGGFSPGLGARLVLADGRRAFAKAARVERHPAGPNNRA